MHTHEMRGKNSTLPEIKLQEGMYILAIYIYIYLLENSSTSDYLPLTVPNRHNSVGVSSNVNYLFELTNIITIYDIYSHQHFR